MEGERKRKGKRELLSIIMSKMSSSRIFHPTLTPSAAAFRKQMMNDIEVVPSHREREISTKTMKMNHIDSYGSPESDVIQGCPGFSAN